jgi:L-lactate dehydrogenase
VQTSNTQAAARGAPHVARVAIIGAGLVGSTTAYALLLSGTVPDIVLIDKDTKRAEGHVQDLKDAEIFSHTTHVRSGDFSDCATADVIIITAGRQQAAARTSRLDDLKEGAAMLRAIIDELGRYNPTGIILVASNPVDVLTYAALKWSGLPANRVIGSGTTLDTSRFRRRLAERFGVAPDNVHAYVLGEHGDSQVPVVSSASIAGMPLEGFCRQLGLPYDPAALAKIETATRRAGFEILQAKGATYYGIGAALARIVGATLRDEHAVLTVSSLAPPDMDLGDVCLSLPAIIDRGGVSRVLPTPLSASERRALEKSAELLKQYAAAVVPPESPTVTRS